STVELTPIWDCPSRPLGDVNPTGIGFFLGSIFIFSQFATLVQDRVVLVRAGSEVKGVDELRDRGRLSTRTPPCGAEVDRKGTLRAEGLRKISNMLEEGAKTQMRGWLERRLAEHLGTDNEVLVDYVVAIVGKAEGRDDDLRETWTEKLEDFLGDSSGDFVDQLLQAIRTGNFGAGKAVPGNLKGGNGDGSGNSGDNSVGPGALHGVSQEPYQAKGQHQAPQATMVQGSLEGAKVSSSSGAVMGEQHAGRRRGRSDSGSALQPTPGMGVKNSLAGGGVAGNSVPKRPRGEQASGRLGLG
ncbi:unnamed protein product, partial [Discosporangium mesarthrocarpum]